ncbi:MAG: DNA-binding transcriptional regulator [Phycisphaeraceae bacterium]
MPIRPRIALLIESSRAYGRGLLHGIAQYARVHGHWSIFQQERMLDDPAPRWIERWKGDGIIARLENPELVEVVRRLKIPTIDVRGLFELPDIPLVETDDDKVIRLAIKHLRERGFHHFAFCGFAGANYSERRLRYLRRQLGDLNLPLHIYAQGTATLKTQTVEIETRGTLYDQTIASWLASLPRPIGLIACNDIRGQQVLNAARDAGIAVPEEIAVIGVDNDEVVCDLSDPPLTSVEPDTRRIGYEAAAVLDGLMRGKHPKDHKTFVRPAGVITRQSTDILAIADRDIASAVRFIRQHATEEISVEDVLEQVPMSRSTLERRFSKLIGHSPKTEILRVRLDRVKRLLAETDYSLAAIAGMTGFKHAEYLSTVFKQKMGKTPGQFRGKAKK